jgi:cation transport regulator
MPYMTNEDLPPSPRRRLPEHGQDIYRTAFNRAWDRYRDIDLHRLEEIAHRVAWSSVKRKYRKSGEVWVPGQIL